LKDLDKTPAPTGRLNDWPPHGSEREFAASLYDIKKELNSDPHLRTRRLSFLTIASPCSTFAKRVPARWSVRLNDWFVPGWTAERRIGHWFVEMEAEAEAFAGEGKRCLCVRSDGKPLSPDGHSLNKSSASVIFATQGLPAQRPEMAWMAGKQSPAAG
jgi:hypothetical protein